MGLEGLNKQTFTISLGTGIDTKTDPNQVLPSSLIYLKNAVLTKLKRISKRNGYASLGTVSIGNALATYKDELLALDGTNIKSRSSFDSSYYTKGQKVAVNLSVKTIISNSYEQTNADSAIHSAGIRVFTWDDSSGGSRYSVFDSTTGQSIISSQLISSTASRTKAITLGNYILIFFIESSTLKYIAIPAATPGSPVAAATIATVTQSAYDVAVINGAAVIVYSDATPLTSIRSLSATLILGSAYQVSKNVSRLSVFGDSTNRAWVGWIDSAGTTYGYFIVDAALTGTVLAPTNIETGLTYLNITGYHNGTDGVFFAEVNATEDSNHYVRKVTVTSAGSVGTPATLLRSVGLFSKPFTQGSKTYLTVTHGSELQSSYFVIDTDGRVIAKIAPSSGGGLRTDGIMAQVNADGAGKWSMAYLIKDFVTSVSGDVTTQTGVSQSTLDFNAQIVSATIGDNQIYSGAVVSMYDGVNVCEQGFHLYPENITSSFTPIGGSFGTGQRQYKAIYSWIDNQGQIHRSAPSIAEEVEFASTGIFCTGTANGTNTNQFLVEYGTDNAELIIPGMRVSGASLPANTYVDVVTPFDSTRMRVVTSATGTTTSGTAYVLTFTQNLAFRAITTVGSSIVTFIDSPFKVHFGSSTAGSNQITLESVEGLLVGHRLTTSVSYEDSVRTSVVTISSITGNTVTLSANASETFEKAAFIFTAYFTGTFTSGTNQITNVSNPEFFRVGQVMPTIGTNFTNVFTGRTVTNVSGTTVTFNGTQSLITGTADSFGGISLDSYLFETQTITPITSGVFTGLPVIDSVSDPTIVLDQQAQLASSAVTLFTSDVGSAKITFPTLRITEKVGFPVAIEVYRTEANGNVFYKTNQTTIINDTSIDSVEFVDTTSDRNLIGNELLYTTGDVVENIGPPASDYIFNYKNRVILIPSENKSQAWFSKPVLPGTPIEFSDTFTLNVSELDRDLVCGSQMDDKLVFFKQNSIFFTNGDGPNNTGAQNDFGDPQALPTDVGCVDPKSVILMPKGLMFKSNKGIYLLDRSLSVNYIGDRVEDYNQYSVTSANLIEDFNQIRFSLSGTSAILVFDYYSNNWYVFDSLSAVDAVIYRGNYTYIQSNGAVLTEQAGLFTDNGAHIPISLRTAWVSLAGIQGFQRAYELLVLGDYASPHTLSISVAYDFENTYTQTVSIPVSTAPSGKYQYRVKLNRQKCQTVQLTLSESQSSPFGEGLSLSAFSMIVGAKRGLDKKGQAKNYG